MACSQSFAQDVLRCDWCEDIKNPVEAYCVNCAANLCYKCLADHISSLRDVAHEIITYKELKERVISPVCEIHKNTTCELFCLDCDVPACTKCISPSHKKHELIPLGEKYKSKEEEIELENHLIDTAMIPKYEAMLSGMVFNLSTESTENFENKSVTSAIEQNQQIWIQAINDVAERYKQEAEEKLKQSPNAFMSGITALKQTLSALRKRKKQNTEILNSNNHLKRLQFKTKYDSDAIQEPLFNSTLPLFVPKEVNLMKLYNDFGTLHCHGSVANRELMKTIRHRFTFDSHITPLSKVHVTKEQTVFVSGFDNILRSFDAEGRCFNIMALEKYTSPFDFDVTNNGEIMYSVWKQKQVKMFKNSKVEDMIQFDDGWGPKGICCTSDGDILVCAMKVQPRSSKVLFFREKIIYDEISNDEKNKPYFKDACYIVENGNGDICISDKGNLSVPVFDRKRNLRFTYKGNNASIDPHSIATDSLYNILVLDGKTNSIHVISHNGEFLTQYNDLKEIIPHSISVDDSNYLYIGEYESGLVAVIKYTS